MWRFLAWMLGLSASAALIVGHVRAPAPATPKNEPVVGASQSRRPSSAARLVAQTRWPAPAAPISEPFAFNVPDVYPLGDWLESHTGSPGATAIGDVTGDGRDDAVMVTETGFGADLEHRVFVYEPGPDGRLKTPVAYPYSAGLFERADNFPAVSMVLADLNRDGIDDIVVGYGKGVAVFVAQGGGQFAIRKHLIAPEYRNLDPVSDNHFVRLVVTLDIDRDGALDLVAFNQWNGATLFFGDGHGDFVETRSMQSPAPRLNDVKVGDVTGDGFADLVVLSGERPTPKFWILPNVGARQFGMPVIHDIGSDESHRALAIGDFDADGSPEIVVAVFANRAYSRLLHYRRLPLGGYVAHKVTATYDLPAGMIATDLDRDARTDLVIDHHGWEVAGHYLAGDFEHETLSLTAYNSSAPWNTQALSAGDLNGDGCTDIAISDVNFGLLVLRGKHCRAKPAPPLPGSCGLVEVAAGAAGARALPGGNALPTATDLVAGPSARYGPGGVSRMRERQR